MGERRFYVLGLVLQPQDFIYLAALLVISALALFFFTAIAGRLWCGYSCPQTVYTEMFLWLERVTEGDRSARMRLDAQPWTPAKLARKGSKQVLWIALALLTGFTFVGYFTPIRELPAALMVPAESPWPAPARSPSRCRSSPTRNWATASTARSACRSARPASTSATACSTSASPAGRASMPATR